MIALDVASSTVIIPIHAGRPASDIYVALHRLARAVVLPNHHADDVRNRVLQRLESGRRL